MTPPRSVIGSLARLRVIRRPWPRRAVAALLVLVLALLTLFPERYRAAVTLIPSVPVRADVRSGSFADQAATEIAVRIAGSVRVREAVAQRLDLGTRLGTGDPVAVSRWLARNVIVRTVRGGIVQIETSSTDPAFARALVGATAQATQDRLPDPRVLEPPHVDTARQVNTLPMSLALLVAMLLLSVEFYTLRPPVGGHPEAR